MEPDQTLDVGVQRFVFIVDLKMVLDRIHLEKAPDVACNCDTAIHHF